MNRTISALGVVGIVAVLAAGPAQAALISVAGGPSSMGTLAAIIPAPSDALDDIVTNTGMEGFDEAQGVVTTVAHGIDGGGFILVSTLVDSHMIFLNSAGSPLLTHSSVLWTFDGLIIGVMSDSMGALEAASTFELGNPATNYTATFGGSGPAAPFPARGLEGGDSYVVAGNTITVTMGVTEPGDWIRVVTRVPEPASLGLMGLGLIGTAFAAARKRRG